MKFELGRLLATPGAIEAFVAAGENPANYVGRHVAGDWGDVCDDDKRANDEALVSGERLLCAYRLKTGEKIWIITEAESAPGERSATTILLPEEY